MALTAHAESRQRNLARVLRLLHDGGAMRQVDISDATGLTRSTGISLVEELGRLGLVSEREAEAARLRGRPSPLIAPSDNVVVVAAEIAARTARVGVIALGGTLLTGAELSIEPSRLGPQRTLRHIAQQAAGLLSGHPTRRVIGAAIALHGAVDDERHVVFAPNLGWEGADLGVADDIFARILTGHSSPRVVVGNDADLGALAELRRGAGRGRSNFIYLSAERGVGGGLVIDGELVRGSAGVAGEVGHVKVSTGAHVCACGQHGCWETEIGASAIERAGGGRSVNALLELAALRDNAAVRAVDHVAGWLGRGIGVLVPLLQPEVIIVGGHLARIVELADPAVHRAIQETCPPRLARNVEIVANELGSDAAFRGAAEVAFSRLLDDPAGSAESVA